MKRNRLFLLIILLNLPVLMFSQIDIRNKIEIWYKAARFEVADINKNKSLSKDEMAHFPDEFIFYFNKDNFDFSDFDKNGELDSVEMEKKWDSERSLRDIFEKQKIRQLNTVYLSLPIADTKYLKQNPELVVELLKNAFWLNDNPFLTAQLLQKKRFITESQGLMESLNRNLYWLALNPQVAVKLYDYCNANALSPEIAKWRDSHQKFMKKNKRALSLLYDTQFVQ